MDGGSTDGSVDILRSVGGAIRWRSEPDRGQSHAINKAFDVSKGEIIGWINSDDAYFDRYVIEDVIAAFARYPDADVIYGHLAQIAPDGTIIWFNWTPRFSPRLLRITNFIGQPVAFIRRSALEIPMLDESFHFAMDYDLWLRLAAKGCRFRRINRIIAADRHHPDRKAVQLADVLQSDFMRLEDEGRRGYPAGKRVLSWGFYASRRALGAMLIPKMPSDLAFTQTRTSRLALLKRQLFSWRKRWPEDYAP